MEHRQRLSIDMVGREHFRSSNYADLKTILRVWPHNQNGTYAIQFKGKLSIPCVHFTAASSSNVVTEIIVFHPHFSEICDFLIV